LTTALHRSTSVSAAGADSHLIESFVSRETLLDGGFLQVVRDSVTLPDGALATREFVVHPGAVMIIPITPDGQLVLERQFRYPVGKVFLEFPAGKLDPNEAPFSCAQRELREETGFSSGRWAHAGVLHTVMAYSSEAIDVWFAFDVQPGPTALDDGEFIEVVFRTQDELQRACATGVITDAKTMAGALWLWQWREGMLPLSFVDPVVVAKE
jgi:ADP-ribose pyrophosphatase